MTAEARTARLTIALRALKRAEGLVRQAVRALSAALGDADDLGVVHVTDAASADRAAALASLEASRRRGGVDVVILARSGGRTPQPNGIGETPHGPQRTQATQS